MRILYLTQWFEPEPNIIKGIRFARALQAAGHRVTVVTGFPNYPEGKLYPGYRLRWLRRETVEGVEIVRLPLYPSHDRSSLRRSLNFLSFFLSLFCYLLLRLRRFDLAYVYHPPITVGLATALAGSMRRLPFILDVQDLWPDTLAATGMPGAGRLVRPIGAMCRLVYRRADAIIVQSEGMQRVFVERGVPATKLAVIRNWAVAETPPARKPREGPCRVVYAGNLGTAQGLGTALDAAARLADAGIAVELALYGDGIEAVALRTQADGAHNVRFMGRVPTDAMPAVFGAADALLLHLADHPLFAITIPSKVQAYLAAGRPIVAGIAGEAAMLLRQSGAAIVVPPGDPAALAEALARFAALPPAEREAMGARGREYYSAQFSFNTGIDRTIRLLRDTYANMHRKGGNAAS